MGFRYGEHKYSEGLYSRWPDWWHAKDCLNDLWGERTCDPLAVEIVPPPSSSWAAAAACDPPFWTTTPDTVPTPWKAAPQQAVMKQRERIWRPTR